MICPVFPSANCSSGRDEQPCSLRFPPNSSRSTGIHAFLFRRWHTPHLRIVPLRVTTLRIKPECPCHASFRQVLQLICLSRRKKTVRNFAGLFGFFTECDERIGRSGANIPKTVHCGGEMSSGLPTHVFGHMKGSKVPQACNV